MLKKIFSLILILFSFASVTVAQQSSASLGGTVMDSKTDKPMEYAAVTLKSTADSSRILGAITNAKGEFKISDIKPASYHLKVTFLGFKPFVKNINVIDNNAGVNLGVIKLENDGISLKEVAVQGERTPVIVKKDTLEFNASSFKTRPDATTEELLKKLPGVQVDKDGNITVAGQKVERLTVDGKDFFGTDPKTATQNLPADAIEKVQIVDSKTQEAKATGIDDGQREKVLNLSIKKDKKKGWFGNASITGGNNDRYNGYLSANRFQDDKQLAILAMSNNTNAANFSYQDLQSFSGGNLGNIFAPPGGGGFNINVDHRGNTTIGGSGVFDNAGKGLLETHAGGINYSNSFGDKKKLKFSGSYFTYFSDATQNKLSNLQDLASADILRTNENNSLFTDNSAHRFNMKFEFNPDSLTDITFRPNVILNNTTILSNRTFISRYDQKGLSNDGRQDFTQNNSTPSFFGEFVVLRRLGKDKGSVSLRLSGNRSEVNTGWNNLYSLNNYSGSGTTKEDINQHSDQETNATGYTINGNYVKPFNKKWSSNLSYQYTESKSLATQLSYDYNPVTDSYEIIVPALSNTFDYKNWNQSVRTGLNFNNKSWTANFGFGVQQSGLTGVTLANNSTERTGLEKTYWNIVPAMGFTYKPKNNRSIQVNYRLNVFMPAVNNLQPVQNNSNPLYQRQGNPELDQTKSHRVTVNYNTFKPGTDLYWNGYFAYNHSFDAISNDTRIVDGIQYVKPVNVDGNYNLNTGTNFGFPTKLKGLRFMFGAYLFASHSKNFINTEQNNTNRFVFGPYSGINYDIDEKLNLSFLGGIDWSKVNNDFQAAMNQKYYRLNGTINLSYEFVKNLRFETDLNQNGYYGRGEGFDRQFYLLNAGFVKYFMNRKVNIALKGFDILKQNISINREAFNTRIEDVRYDNLTRYFFLRLTYRLAKVGPKGEKDHPRSTVN